MSKKRSRPAKVQEAEIDAIMREGYYIVEHTIWHVRIQDRVDFYPPRGKWFDAGGFRDERRGVGIDTLITYLKENYPIANPIG